MYEPTEKMLKAANESGLHGNWIGERIDNLDIPNTDQSRLSACCLHVSMTHHISIGTLVAEGMISSAFALLRPQIDGYVRGLWLHKIASLSYSRGRCMMA